MNEPERKRRNCHAEETGRKKMGEKEIEKRNVVEEGKRKGHAKEGRRKQKFCKALRWGREEGESCRRWEERGGKEKAGGES